MEKMVEALVRSDRYPANLKQALIAKVITSVPLPATNRSSDALTEMFELGARWLQQNAHPLESFAGESLLRRVATPSVAGGGPFAAFFNTDKLLQYIDNISYSLENVINMLRVVLSLKDTTSLRRDCIALQSRLSLYVNENTASSLQYELARLFIAVPNSRPVAVDISDIALKWLTKITIATPNYNVHVSTVAALLVSSWDSRDDKTSATLIKIFAGLSERQTAILPFALATVLENAAPSFLPMICGILTSPQAKVADHALELATFYLSNLPLSVRLGEWVQGMLVALSNSKRYSVLSRIIVRSAPIVVNQLYIPSLRAGAFLVLEYMLLGYQHTPDLFHSLLPKLTSLVAAIQHEIGEVTTTDEEQKTNPPTTSVESNEQSSAIGEATSNKSDADTPASGQPQQPQPQPQPQQQQPQKRPRIESPSQERPNIYKEDRAIIKLSGVSLVPVEVLRQLLTLHVDEHGKVTVNHGNKAADDAHTKAILECLCELLYILIYHHTGYPEMYSPLLKMIRAHKSPSDDSMKATIAKRAWTKDPTDAVGVMLGEVGGKSISGKAGLVNLGNTCYMNSFLQALFLTDPLRTLMVPLHLPPWQTPANDRLLTMSELQRVFVHLLLTQRKAYTPRSFLKVLPPWYQTGVQQDTSEFGKHLLDRLEAESKQTPLKTQIASIFGGKLTNYVMCRRCHNVSEREEDFTDIPLAFLNSLEPATLENMVAEFFKPEPLEDDNKYLCNLCASYQDADKRYKITTAPDHLILTLKRFAYDVKLSTRVKIMDNVTYPLTLSIPVTMKHEITEPTSADTKETTPTGKTTEDEDFYSLYAVIMHSGTSAHHGHYYCYARHSDHAANSPVDESPEDKCWYLFNDSFVDKSSYHSFSSITKNFSKDVPYVLFYRKKESLSSTTLVQDFVRDNTINPALMQEVSRDNSMYIVEQENVARRRLQASMFFCPPHFSPCAAC
eukprot:TRINITY_DN7947_c0_g1_i1.p1 TRINITY_DN7947_c0_g1~~TRINITY_DN7947_c0_g1_i1.p1  ORF type:complete len:964 (+),score=126.86 TRINITY_DN7947_c0_g1_i1:22-2892(+)